MRPAHTNTNMSVTRADQVSQLVEWLQKNAFWNHQVLEVKPLSAATGVFYQNPDDERLLLRIPKSNILSPKNLLIWNLLVDFAENHLAIDTVDLTHGMHSVVLCFVYEVANGAKSPWYQYVQSILPDEETTVPICLWEREEKEALHNTDVDLLNMLDDGELTSFYVECVRFAHLNRLFVDVPEVFDIEGDSEEIIANIDRSKLILFGKYVQTVISRAFEVDEYHGLSMVPGADLFNHIAPELDDDRIVGRENVHFECDGEVCEVCGEFGCEDHDEDDYDIAFDEEGFPVGEDEGDEQQSDDESDNEGDEANDNDDMDQDSLLGSDVSDELDSSSDDDLDESLDEASDIESMTEDFSGDSGADSEAEATLEEITLDYIKKLEESEAESEEQDSDDESGDDESDSEVDAEGPGEDLMAELADGSKCCDIVLARVPEPGEELFNTYGNHLSNAYLLQRYGFITQPNPNDGCLLSVQLFQWMKQYRAEKPEHKVRQLDNKLAWYEEMGFEFVNDLVCQYESRPALEEDDGEEVEEVEEEEGEERDGEDEDEEGEEMNGCDLDCESCDGDDVDEHTQILQENLPESWQLSPRVTSTGPTPQTYALVKLLLLPYKVFHYKFIECASERKLANRIFSTLLPYEEDKYTAPVHDVIRSWCKQRLAKYRTHNLTGPRADIIDAMISLEKAILLRTVGESPSS